MWIVIAVVVVVCSVLVVLVRLALAGRRTPRSVSRERQHEDVATPSGSGSTPDVRDPAQTSLAGPPSGTDANRRAHSTERSPLHGREPEDPAIRRTP